MEISSEELNNGKPSDHLANERTFLAWIRTSIGIMGFGFVVVKFSLFMREVTAALNGKPTADRPGFSHEIGILLVALGAITILTSYLRYHRSKRQLDLGKYYQSTLSLQIVTGVIFIVSIVLLLYLMHTN